jgi:23S rRNA (adenine2030-N6)-methyltransferase
VNYRHIYHAGNFADVLKHIVLMRIIEHLQKKEKAFRLYDTHAGIGLYDLTSEAAQKTGEWRGGIGKLLQVEIQDEVAGLIQPYLQLIESFQGDSATIATYPGSPAIARKMLRAQDRLALYELHPQDAALLKRQYAGDHQVKVTELDGWLALGAHVPPKERRGAVLIDPPFEATDEFSVLHDRLLGAHGKWEGGTYAAWFPAKNSRAVAQFVNGIRHAGIKDVLLLSLSIDDQKPDGPMVSTGMLLINPPYSLADEMRRLLPFLHSKLALAPDRGGWDTEIVSAG